MTDGAGSQELDLPSERRIRHLILQVIAEAGGELRARDINLRAATRAGLDEAPSDTATDKARRWLKRGVEFSRGHLRDEGLLENPERGLWKLTDAGRSALQRDAAAGEAPTARRIRVEHLLEAGLLSAGDQLEWQRPQVGERHLAEVTPDGLIRIANGDEERSPSKAASSAAGAGFFNGWKAWTRDGVTLDELRSRYRELHAEDDHTPAREQVRRRTTWLDSARRRADAGSPEEISVRAPIALWGASGRNADLDEALDTDLANCSSPLRPSPLPMPGCRSSIVNRRLWRLEGQAHRDHAP